MNKIISFDGLSLAGKSTAVGMLALRSKEETFEIIQENGFDPLRKYTSLLNKKLKSIGVYQALDEIRDKFSENPLISQTVQETERYLLDINSRDEEPVSNLSQDPLKLAALAYFFTKGRSIVNQEVSKKLKEGKNIILDRWALTGMTYQVSPPFYNWTEIRDLNEELGVTTPDMQFILTCPIEQIPQRKQFRTKIRKGTAGQMSKGREDIISKAFQQAYKYYSQNGTNHWTIMIKNKGTPVFNLEEQIAQAVPTYIGIEKHIRKHMPEWNLKNELNQKDLIQYFIDNQEFLYGRQCLGRVKVEVQKEI